MIAAAFAVLDAGGDGGDAGLVAAARTLPLVLFLLIGDAVADRLPRHRVMVAANAATLTGAYLRYTALGGAMLAEADLRGADLSEVRGLSLPLTDVRTDERTLLPPTR